MTWQQPMVNIVRAAYQALAAVLGGTQSLHTDSYDEAWAVPSEGAALIALRTQQVPRRRNRCHKHNGPAGWVILCRMANK